MYSLTPPLESTSIPAQGREGMCPGCTHPPLPWSQPQSQPRGGKVCALDVPTHPSLGVNLNPSPGEGRYVPWMYPPTPPLESTSIPAQGREGMCPGCTHPPLPRSQPQSQPRGGKVCALDVPTHPSLGVNLNPIPGKGKYVPRNPDRSGCVRCLGAARAPNKAAPHPAAQPGLVESPTSCARIIFSLLIN